MKKNKWSAGILLFAASLLFGVACSKEEQPVTVPVTRAQLLARSWIQTDLLAAIPGGSQSSVFTTVMTSCQRDNIWLFKSDGTYTITEGATKCNSTDPDTATSGTWQLTENDTKIIVDDVSQAPQTFTINELTSSSLKISGTQVVQGTSVNGTAVFAPQ